MSAKIKVYTGDNAEFGYRITRKFAEELISRGLAISLGKREIRRVYPNREVVRTSDAMKSSGQHDAYELAAIEPFCNLVQGGGVNGKHRQLTYKPFSAAHIGHQP